MIVYLFVLPFLILDLTLSLGVWNEMVFVYNGGVESRLLGTGAAKDSLDLIAKVPEDKQGDLTKKWFEMFPGGG